MLKIINDVRNTVNLGNGDLSLSDEMVFSVLNHPLFAREFSRAQSEFDGILEPEYACYIMAHAMSNSQNINTISFAWWQTQGSMVRNVLMGVMTSSCSVASLDFSLSNIGDSDIEVVKECLLGNPSISSLKLDSTSSVSNAGVESLLSFLSDRGNIVNLTIESQMGGGFNEINFNVVQNFLANNRTIENLNISAILVPERESLYFSLRNNNVLKSIELYRDIQVSLAISDCCDALEASSSLQKVILDRDIVLYKGGKISYFDDVVLSRISSAGIDQQSIDRLLCHADREFVALELFSCAENFVSAVGMFCTGADRGIKRIVLNGAQEVDQSILSYRPLYNISAYDNNNSIIRTAGRLNIEKNAPDLINFSASPSKRFIALIKILAMADCFGLDIKDNLSSDQIVEVISKVTADSSMPRSYILDELYNVDNELLKICRNVEKDYKKHSINLTTTLLKICDVTPDTFPPACIVDIIGEMLIPEDFSRLFGSCHYSDYSDTF